MFVALFRIKISENKN